MEILIQSSLELYNYFSKCSKITPKVRSEKLINEGVYVESKIRKEVLCSVEQGKIIIGGTVKRLLFTNVGGGVWKCTVGKL